MARASERKCLDYPRFLKIFQGYPVLWDINDPNYNNKTVSKKCFSQMRQQLADLGLLTATSDASLKKRIWHIQKTYREEKSKVKESGGKYSPTIKWMCHASFLDKSSSPIVSLSGLTGGKRKNKTFSKISSLRPHPFSPGSSQMEFSDASNSQMDYSEAGNSQMDYSEADNSNASSIECDEEFDLPERSISSPKAPTALRQVAMQNSQRSVAIKSSPRRTLTQTTLTTPASQINCGTLVNHTNHGTPVNHTNHGMPVNHTNPGTPVTPNDHGTLVTGRDDKTPAIRNDRRSAPVVRANSIEHAVSPGANAKLPGDAFLNYVVSEFQDLTKQQARDLQDEIYKCISDFRKNIE